MIRGTVAAVTILAALLGATAGQAGEDPAKVLARVNGEDITQADVALADRMYGGSNDGVQGDARTSALVDALIEIKLVAAAAKAAGTDQDADYLRQRALIENQTLKVVYLQKQLAAAVTDEMVRKTYDEQVARIPQVTEIRLRNIVVPSEADARKALDEINAGAPFETVATRLSEGQVVAQPGGDLGYMPADHLPEELAAAVATMAPGQFAAAPVRSAFGFHLLKLEDRRIRPVPSFDSVALQIRENLEDAASRRILADLRAANTVEKLVADVPSTDGDGHAHEPQAAE